MTIATPFKPLWDAAGFTNQTMIQEAVYQPLKQDTSLVGLAPTGSGKTLAFGLPLLEKVVPGDGLQILILSPSQELAIQTRDVLTPYAKAIGAQLQGVTGSANVKRQIEKLKAKPEVIVATPGRLLELITSGRIKLAGLQTIVVDEADELLRDPGLDQVRQIVMGAPADVQLAFFSATASPIMRELEKWFGQEVTWFDVRDQDQTQGPVAHLFIQTDRKHQVDWLRRLAHLPKFQALVFFNQNASLEKAAGILRHQAVSFAVLSRNGRQVARQKALQDFRAGKLTLLLVTDLAGRGLDIPRLPAVINFDVPKRQAAYIHRAGRTGRMGASGYVITLGDDHDRRDLKKSFPEYLIKRGYLVDGELTTTPPKREQREQEVTPDSETPQVVAPKVVQKSKTTVVKPVVEKPKHKKHRARDQKNKGKRQPKKNN
ncbi:DEAD/DEAH box helicase [Lacticaseibacillus brantae]|uniref:ATP-dependent RNA helicase n=1 Tax=Lacticaseibacillus brantae DSM 23927 TaxID=1423727 RepID=A0A0R2B0M4_9LACO|nr:DEAD/DEAH box helicase [Lacticaseibacillus brantae]KRM73070.1 ATP-dependent RNA helicase [Lacticaseibacillus brantae DSM 23927]